MGKCVFWHYYWIKKIIESIFRNSRSYGEAWHYYTRDTVKLGPQRCDRFRVAYFPKLVSRSRSSNSVFSTIITAIIVVLFIIKVVIIKLVIAMFVIRRLVLVICVITTITDIVFITVTIIMIVILMHLVQTQHEPSGDRGQGISSTSVNRIWKNSLTPGVSLYPTSLPTPIAISCLVSTGRS